MVVCSRCDKEVSADSAVSFKQGGRHDLMCQKCAESEVSRNSNWWPRSGPCRTCGRLMYLSRRQVDYHTQLNAKGGWTHPVSDGMICSAECNYRFKLQAKKASRHAAFTMRVCPGCQREFLPRRSDAITCSDRCRQSFFRKKQAHAALEELKAQGPET
jgi:hypothetical protein